MTDRLVLLLLFLTTATAVIAPSPFLLKALALSGDKTYRGDGLSILDLCERNGTNYYPALCPKSNVTLDAK